MERNDLIRDMIEYINSDLGYPVELDEASSLSEDVGLDSLDATDLISYMERKYDFKVEDSELSILKESIGDIVDFILNRLKNESQNIS
ncbi:acyl carrier protein [Intestinibacter sp.]|uniref:acyl carrier protein n=1 Tax=Intestinibacter sp. TaxID=1965304 RepID=UPI003F15B5F9